MGLVLAGTGRFSRTIGNPVLGRAHRAGRTFASPCPYGRKANWTGEANRLAEQL